MQDEVGCGRLAVGYSIGCGRRLDSVGWVSIADEMETTRTVNLLEASASRVSDDPPDASIKVALAAGSYPVLPHPSPYYLTSNPVLRYPTPHSHILPRPTLASPAILLCPTSSYPL